MSQPDILEYPGNDPKTTFLQFGGEFSGKWLS